MQIKIDSNSFFVFDLDDTLFPEVEFLKSAYLDISLKLTPFTEAQIYEEMLERYQKKENVFEWILTLYQHKMPHLQMDWLLREYREHYPKIVLADATASFLKRLSQASVPMGLITDGRSITQRNKLRALGIEKYFTDIIISEEFGSEKPDERNYLHFSNHYPGKNFYFFGDNTSKDFIVPIKLGWNTICLKNQGNHIHNQKFDQQPGPDHIISSFNEIELI